MVAVNPSQYGAGWAGLVQEKKYAEENLVKARRSGDEMQIAYAEKRLAEAKIEMAVYDKGFVAGRASKPKGAGAKVDYCI